jgi:hypothetical protein
MEMRTTRDYHARDTIALTFPVHFNCLLSNERLQNNQWESINDIYEGEECMVSERTWDQLFIRYSFKISRIVLKYSIYHDHPVCLSQI